MAITKITKNAFPASIDLSSVDLTIGNDEIVTANIADTNITHAKLHTDMDLSSKTVTLPTISSLTVSGGNTHLDGRNSAGLTLDLAGSAHYTIREHTTDDIVKLGGTGSVNFIAHNISSGNVGIGQSSPDARLDLGTLNSSTAGSNQMFQLGAFGFRHEDTGGFNHLYLERNYGGWQTTPQMTFKANGNVGIGTDSPRDVLEVSRTSTDQTAGLTLTNLQAGGYGSGIVWKSVRSDGGSVLTAAEIVVAGENAWNSDGNTASQMQFWTQKDNTLTRHMTLTKNGYLGIGTSSPQAKLHVTSSVLIEGGSTDSRTLGFTNASGSTGWSIGNGIIDSTHNFRIYDNTAGAARVTVSSNGYVGIGNTSPDQKLTIGTDNSTSDVGYIRLRGHNTLESNIYKTANYGIHMDTDSNSQGIRIDGGKLVLGMSGNVGIGTETPSNQLEVTGGTDRAAISVTNADLGNVHYSDKNNRYLTSNGSGWGSVDGVDPGIVIAGYNTTSDIKQLGLVLHNDTSTTGTYSPSISFGAISASGSYNTSYAHIIGKRRGTATDANWASGELHFFTQPDSEYVNSQPSMLIHHGGQVEGSMNGRHFSLDINGWYTFGRLYRAQSTPLRIKVLTGHNSYGDYQEFTNDTYAYNIAVGTTVTVGSTSGNGVTIRKIKRVGGDYSGGDGGWEYQISRTQSLGTGVRMHIMGATVDWTWTL